MTDSSSKSQLDVGGEACLSPTLPARRYRQAGRCYRRGCRQILREDKLAGYGLGRGGFTSGKGPAFDKMGTVPMLIRDMLQIWQIADTDDRGLLTQVGFCMVLRLIGHYQAGRDPSAELALRRMSESIITLSAFRTRG